MKKIISIILVVVLFISLLLFTFFYSIQQEFSLFNKVSALEFTKEDLERYSQMDLSQLHKEFDDQIVSQGLPTEILDYVVEHPDYDNTINEFKEDYISYLKGQGEKPTVNQDKMNKILNDSVSNYNKENENKIDTDKANFITDKISETFEETVNKIDDSKGIKSALTFIFNTNYQKYAFIIAVVVLIAIIVLQKLNATLYLSIPFILNGILYMIGYVISKSSILNFVKNILGKTYIKTSNSFLTFGIVYLVLGIALVVMYIFVVRKKVVKQ